MYHFKMWVVIMEIEMLDECPAATVYCSCVGKLFSHSLQSFVPMHILCTGVYAHGHETLQGIGK